MRIGFIDYHLNNYHADVFYQLLTGKVGGGQVEIVAAYESSPVGEDWCAKHHVARAATPEEVIAQSDAIMVLAPDNFEAHFALARPALESGKPVFIDKILAQTLAHAKQMLALAQSHNTPVMSSSALRFALELEELLSQLTHPAQALFSRGFGNWAGYGIHTLAPALRVLGRPIARVCDTGDAYARLVTLDAGPVRAFLEVRSADNQQEVCPWQIGVLADGHYYLVTVRRYDEFYENLIRAVLAFFRTGNSPVSTREMLDSVAVLRAAEESMRCDGAWITLETH